MKEKLSDGFVTIMVDKNKNEMKEKLSEGFGN